MHDCRYLAIAAAMISLPVTHGAAQLPVDTLALKAHTYFLAHDLLSGRATGTAGADISAAYIASQCRALGLAPAGSSYTQTIALEEATIGLGTQVTLAEQGGRAVFTYPADFTPNVGTSATLAPFAGPAVYLGSANEIDDELLDGLDLQGAVAVADGPRIARGVLDNLKARGAVGVVHALPDARTYSLYWRSRGENRLYHSDPTIPSSYLPPLPSLLAGPRLSASLTGETPPNPGPLGATIEFSIRLSRRTIDAANVACLLNGAHSTMRDTVIIFSAHYDHLGVGVPDTAGDAIYNGFADNAAGVAMLLGIAQAMGREVDQPMQHSVLFLFFVGEERGLLGSDYYVARPLWPLNQTRAVINLDGGAPAGLLVNWRLAGVDSTGLGAAATSVAQSRGWQVTTSPPTPNSDYYPFVRNGIPAVFIIPGPGAYEGLSADSSDALRHRWRYYHDPQDEWTEDFPFSGLQRYAEYAYLLARRLDSTQY